MKLIRKNKITCGKQKCSQQSHSPEQWVRLQLCQLWTLTPAVKKRRRKNSLTTNTRVKEYDASTGMEISNEYDNLSDCIFEDDDTDAQMI